MKIGSLFSGIGGLELGLEWSGLGRTIWQCESDPFCRARLSEHWPEARLYDDVRTLEPTALAAVDLICGGFPCQDVSSAGKGAGLGGARSGLWYEFLRVVAGCRPRWVVVENVASGAKRWVDAVRGDLERVGYATLPVPLSAEDVGAPHLRRRIFVLACLGNATGPRLEEGIRPPSGSFWNSGRREEPSRRGALMANSSRFQPRRQEQRPERERAGSRSQPATDSAQLMGEAWPEPRLREENSEGFLRGDDWWLTEPDVGRVAHGVPSRVERLRALGNAVVPQCAEVVGWMIRELEGGS